MEDEARLIEVAFPLKQASIDSVHEKNVRHGHISTLHIWPARRPLAASRAALLATLLPDPGSPEERRKLVERIGGRVVRREVKKNGKAIVIEETEGGILHWGREANPDLAWFREEIRKAYGGRAPRVLDPFAGGGAIPLEAMRLGCEVTAIDINPVAWFILRCTLEYPQRFAGLKRPLPAFALTSPEFMDGFRKGLSKSPKRGRKGSGQTAMFDAPAADLAWHIRAWGNLVEDRARQELARFYPLIKSKPTVAYIWARTVTCKNCRTTIPLLKTTWLQKKERGWLRLAIKPAKDRSGVTFRLSTMSSSEAQNSSDTGTIRGSGPHLVVFCPVCDQVTMSAEDVRFEGKAGRIGALMVAVACAGPDGREFRLPTAEEASMSRRAGPLLKDLFEDIPFGLPDEPINTGSIRKGGVSVTRWGLDRWCQLFTDLQLLTLGTIVRATRKALDELRAGSDPPEWQRAVSAYLAIAIDRTAERSSSICHYDVSRDSIAGTFQRYALPLNWDFAEGVPIGEHAGSYQGQIDWIARVVDHTLRAVAGVPMPRVALGSATGIDGGPYDIVVTDPPYYDSIPYADLMDFFYVWLRRSTHGLDQATDAAFEAQVFERWNSKTSDGELIDDESRFGGDSRASKVAYEEGMFRAFCSMQGVLAPKGRMVVVFANKQPDAWESLVSAIIRAGFIVDGSWPIQTEMGNRTRALTSAALSSSVWLVCKKRPDSARPGWDNRVLDEMRENIYKRLREFWDAGIRGPDFVWAATGPAMEAYSKHPVVKKANEPGQLMAVSEFLRQVRRIVVDFVVGRVLTRDGGEESAVGLDDVTTYYLLHRHDFGMGEAPAGACILYAVSCGVSDRDLSDQWDVLARTGGKAAEPEDSDDTSDDTEEAESAAGSGSKVRLKTWEQRRRKSMGFDAEGRPAPLIDQVHRLLHLWRAGDVAKVDDYLDVRALRKNQLFHKLLQALIELAPEGSEERGLMESVSNHVSPRTQPAEKRQRTLPIGTEA